MQIRARFAFAASLALFVASPALAAPRTTPESHPAKGDGAKAEVPTITKPATKASHDEKKASARMARAENARGLYVRGETTTKKDFDNLLEKAVQHGLDTVVLDAKDYDGLLTYPSKVALAIESGATKHAPIEDFAATIAHIKSLGLRVAVRVSCFEDELMAKAKPSMSVQSKAGRAYPIGWLDPSNPEVQAYVLDLVKEAIASGADEVQLDYVRYPVLGIKNADFKLEARGLTKPQVIRDFVHRAHAITKAEGVPLSLDVFGVIAFGKRDDIDRLGQDPALLASECEVLSPMVYPSHYAPGFSGFDSPGDHPELVGRALAAMHAQIDAAGVARPAVLRPWLQAMPWKTETFSSAYVAREIKSADENGSSGFLLWNPGQTYNVSLAAIRKPEPAATVHKTTAHAPKPREPRAR